MLNCLIVEDEPLAQQVLQQHISQSPGLRLIATCNNVTRAFEILHTYPVDLIFLDIKMPGISGIDFLRSLKNPPAVIFTTAFTEYAVESYELNAVDYLLKPVTLERFKKSIRKFLKPPVTVAIKPAEATHLYVKVKFDLVKVNYADILYVEAKKDYLQICTRQGQVLTHMTMKSLEEVLPQNRFVRTHRSFIVAIAEVKVVGKRQLLVGGLPIPIGDSYRKNIMAVLK